MTREQKLGLIIGFTVVLVFGVLIADHLSRARTEPLITADAPDEPLVIPAIADLKSMSDGFLPTPREMASAGVSEPRPLLDESTREASASGLVPVMGPPSGAADESGRGLDIASIFEPEAEREPAARSSASGVLPGFVPVTEPSRPQIRDEMRAPVTVPTEPTTAERPRTHRVRRGETLFAISERYYGNGHLWRELAKHNTSVVDAEGRVNIDVTLKIPAKRLLADEPGSGRGSVPTTGATAGIVSSQVGYYTVREGDTLSEISQHLLGTMRRMDDLIRMNSDQIKDADDIRVGMKLRFERGPQA